MLATIYLNMENGSIVFGLANGITNFLLGDYSGTEVYITYRTVPAILADTISSLYLSQQAPFILMVPTMKNVTPEMQQFIDKNKFILLSMADELTLQTDGSFKPKEASKNNMNICLRRFWIDYHNANEEHI